MSGPYSEFRHSTPNVRCGIYLCQGFFGALVPIVTFHLGYVDLKSDYTSMLLPETWLLLQALMLSFVDRAVPFFSWTRRSLRDGWTHSAKKKIVVIGKLVL